MKKIISLFGLALLLAACTSQESTPENTDVSEQDEVSQVNCLTEYVGEISQVETHEVNFKYPCDWIEAQNGVESPDGRLGFYYPAPDLGLHGAETTETTVALSGTEYPAIEAVYSSDGFSQIFIETNLGQYEYDVMIAAHGGYNQVDFQAILDSFSVNIEPNTDS